MMKFGAELHHSGDRARTVVADEGPLEWRVKENNNKAEMKKKTKMTMMMMLLLAAYAVILTNRSE
jgi:hypothetical protein